MFWKFRPAGCALSCLSILALALVNILAPGTAVAEAPFTANFELSFDKLHDWQGAGEGHKHGIAAASSDSDALTLEIPVADQERLEVHLTPLSLGWQDGNSSDGLGPYHFRGSFTGQQDTEFARISLYFRDDGQPVITGWVAQGGRHYHVDTFNRFFSSTVSNSGSGVDLVVTELNFTDFEEFEAQCGDALIPPGASYSMLASSSGPRIAEAGVVREIEIATDADNSYFNLLGENANAEIQSLINIVDGIYESQLNLRLRIVHQNVWTNPDPYVPLPSGSSQFLQDFLNKNSLPNADHKHLFSGRSTGTSAVGVAYLNGTCGQYNVGATTHYGSSAARIVIFAHELGHSIGASHTQETGTCFNPSDIMCYYVQPEASSFVTSSRNQINSFLDSVGTCVTAPSNITYSVSGSVQNGQGPMAGVTVKLRAGSILKSATTNASGTFTINGVANGAYTATAFLNGWAFSPASRLVIVNEGNVSGIAFTGSLPTNGSYKIKGMVENEAGAGLSGATLQLSGPVNKTVTTGALGLYEFSGLPNGAYEVTASLSGYNFNPSTRQTVVAERDVFGIFFTAESLSSGGNAITGTVTDALGNPLQGVTVSSTGATARTTTTNADGKYTLGNLQTGRHTVTAARDGFTFTPASRQVHVTFGYYTGIHFTGTLTNNYSISGFVRDLSGTGVAGATVQLSGALSATTTTDAAGTYVFGGLPAGSYSVSASKAGLTMSPSAHAVAITDASSSDVNFAASSGGGGAGDFANFNGYCPDGIQSVDEVREGEIFDVRVLYKNDSTHSDGTPADWYGYAAAVWDFNKIPLIYPDPEYYGPNRDFPFRRVIFDESGGFSTEPFAFEFLVESPAAIVANHPSHRASATLYLQAPFVDADTDVPLVVQPFRVLGNELVEFGFKCGKVVRVLNQ